MSVMNSVRQSCYVLLAAVATLAVGATAQAQNTQWNLASAYPATNFHTKNLQQFADDVAVASGGRLNITIHPNGSLIKPADLFGAVKDGKVQAAEIIMSSLNKESPVFGVDSLPFLVTGYDDAARLAANARPIVEKLLNDRGLVLLFTVPWPPQNLYASKSVTRTADLKGSRFRTYNPATQRISEIVGAQGVSLPANELGKAISEGKVESMITSSTTGVDTQAWSGMRFFYKVNAWIPKNMVVFNKAAFEKLPADVRQFVQKAAMEAEKRGWQESRNVEKFNDDTLAKNKVQVAVASPFLQDEFRRMGELMAREWLRTAGQTGLDILLPYELDRFKAK